MCHNITAGYEDLVLENYPNDWVVVPDYNAKKQQIKENKKDKPVWKKRTPPNQVRPKPTEQWKTVTILVIRRNKAL
jgi:hypothetical protein